MFNEFLNVSEAQTLSTAAYGDVTIPVANWDCYSLANYLTTQGVNTEVDLLRMKFVWPDKLTVYANGTTCQRLLGLEAGVNYEDITESPQMFDFSGTHQVQLWSNLAVSTYSSSNHNVACCSNLLCTVEVDQPFGYEVRYTDTSGVFIRMFDFTPTYIVLHLTDQDGNVLEPTKEWSVCLVFQETQEEAYQELQQPSPEYFGHQV